MLKNWLPLQKWCLDNLCTYANFALLLHVFDKHVGVGELKLDMMLTTIGAKADLSAPRTP